MRQLENVRELLLRAGIPPRHASRYVNELREHLADLEAQELASGLGAAAARQRALALLGDETQLAQAMIDKSPRSLAARAPWSVLALLPVLLLVCFLKIAGFSMMHLLWPMRDLAPADLPAGIAYLITAVGFITNYLVGPLLAAGCVVAALRQRLNSNWLWVGLGLIALISGLLGFHMSSIPLADGGQAARFSAIGLVYRDGHVDLAATYGLALLRASLLFTAALVAYRALRARIFPSRSEA
jgi:hypothetical protein